MSAAYAEALLDAHVHYHAGFSRRAFFGAAWRNLSAGEHQLRLAGAATKGLMFTESLGADVFGELAAAAGAPSTDAGEWSFEATDEDNSLWAVGRTPDARILLIAGRQLVTREGLEVLALGCRHRFDDSLALRDARDAVIDQGGVPVVPWGFGKWWFARGRLLAELLAAPSPGRWFVGDNAGRPRLSRRPALFARAAEHGVFVLPGSDPLPLSGQEDKPGRCGFRLAIATNAQQPAAAVLAALRECERQPETFGRYEGLSGFARDQVAMQLHKRRRGGAAPAPAR